MPVLVLEDGESRERRGARNRNKVGAVGGLSLLSSLLLTPLATSSQSRPQLPYLPHPATAPDQPTMPVVLVTGASGFLASYVIDAFLATPGWTVRGTVRSLSKAQFLLDRYPTGFELTEVSCTRESLRQNWCSRSAQVTDVIDDKEGLAAAMKGVDAIAHTASPYALTVTDPMRDFINPAVEGTLSVLRAAKEAGIKRVVVTSSFAAVTDFNKGGAWREYNYTDSDWNPTTLEEACEDGRAGAFVYSASKKLAEKAALDFGEKNGLEVVTRMSSRLVLDLVLT